MAITRLVARWNNGAWVNSDNSDFSTDLADLTERFGAPDEIIHCDPSKDCAAWSGNTSFTKQPIHLDPE